jgi:hypothetical protein
MRQATYQWPALRRILPDVFAFAIGLSTAWLLRWKTTDLVWSLWLGSLVLGYLTILSIIGGWVYIGVKVISHAEFPGEYRSQAILIGSVGALFFLGFFSVHFCGFHAGHAVFLSSFFPIEGLPNNVFAKAFTNPILLWKTVFKHLLMVYGGFLVPAIIAERRYVFASIIDAVKAVREGIQNDIARDFRQSGAPGVALLLAQHLKGQNKSPRDPFIRPYINVIRMHILIFFFAFCHMLKVESFFIYAVVYFVYFFPWKAFRKDSSQTQTAPT